VKRDNPFVIGVIAYLGIMCSVKHMQISSMCVFNVVQR
jgi:hypothetical protein